MTKETINGIYTKELTRTYTTSGLKGKNAGMSIDGTNLYTYGYDTYGRLNKITAASGDFTYSRVANSELIGQMTRPNNVTTSWNFEPHRNLLTKVANGNVSTFEYVNNALGNRTSMKRSGSSFATPDTLNYTYDSRSEVIGAVSTAIPAYNFNYAYDPIGNRLTATQEGENFTYASNALNQYTTINAEHPTYDADGNMLTRDGWTQVWNGENRLIATFKGNQRLEFDYDYMGRRIFKKVYEGNILTTHIKFVYDGYKLTQELDALNSNILLRQYVWQPQLLRLDYPLLLQNGSEFYYYYVDANKNITDIVDSAGALAAHYNYSPFGQIFDSSGEIASNNFIRFSSEYCDSESNLVYYNYRYYMPKLAKWLSKDPVEESGGWNLYAAYSNNPINQFDKLGLACMTKYTCHLISSTPSGGCDMNCEYQCIEDVSQRMDSMGGTVDCSQLTPQARMKTEGTTASGNWLCKVTGGRCGKVGVCDTSRPSSAIITDISPRRPCSRSTCKANANAANEISQQLCGQLGPIAERACIATAESTATVAKDVCDAVCTNP